MKPTIAVDVDEVLAQHAQEFVDFSNRNYGTHLTIDDYSDHWLDMWKVDRDEGERRAKEFHNSTHISDMARLNDADKVLKELAKKYRLVIITARRLELEKVTLAWLDKHYPLLFAEVKFVNVWAHRGDVVSKAEVGRELGASYLIDDNPTQCKLAAEAGIKALLFGDYVWNRANDSVEGVTRVANWQEVKEYFDAQTV